MLARFRRRFEDKSTGSKMPVQAVGSTLAVPPRPTQGSALRPGTRLIVGPGLAPAREGRKGPPLQASVPVLPR
jgi:hypothetical protein